MKKILTTLFLIFLPLTTFAWDHSGHQIIAAIAYQHLTPKAKTNVNRLTKLFFKKGTPEKRFLQAAAWPDKIKYNDVRAFDGWHYIDHGYSPDGTARHPISKENVAWAIGQSEKVILSPKATPREKALFLNFLVHFVGDAHQPLHTIELFSKQFPTGDLGGNLYLVKSKYAPDLHGLWDGGLGLFPSAHRFNYKTVVKFANQIQKQYPLSSMENLVKVNDPWQWTKKSFLLARKYAYDIPYNSKPTAQYIKQGRTIVRKRLALAGYRLAYILNSAFANGAIQSS